MIDTHSHILPGVDDGSRNVQESLEMLRLAVDDGVIIQTLTPHFPNNIYGASIESLILVYENFKKIVAMNNINIELRFAAEISMSDEMIPLVKANKIPYIGAIGEKKFLLMEFPFSQLTPGLINFVHWLDKFDITPIIAHPERNKSIQKDISHITPFLDAGCYIQITAGSLNDVFGQETYDTACKLLELNTFTVIASDCHRLDSRPSGTLTEALNIATEIVGENRAKEMVSYLPKQIIDGFS